MLSEKPKKTSSKSSTTNSTNSGSSSSSSTPTAAQEYDKALKELKLQWMKYVTKYYHENYCLYKNKTTLASAKIKPSKFIVPQKFLLWIKPVILCVCLCVHVLCPFVRMYFYLRTCLSICLYTYTPLMCCCHRKKVLDVSEMESEFGNDLDFLMARISCCVDDKLVSKHTSTYIQCK